MVGILCSLVHDGREDRTNTLDYWPNLLLLRGLDQLIAEGRVRKVPPFNPLHPGLEEQWFLDVEAREIWSYTAASERSAPCWEKVDVFETRSAMQQQRDWQAQLGAVERAPGYLAPIGAGRKDTADLYFIRHALPRYIAAGKVEAVEIAGFLPKPGTHAEWYKDNTTGEIYGLVHDSERDEYRWEKAPLRTLTREDGKQLST
jgi:hypothetical protein